MSAMAPMIDRTFGRLSVVADGGHTHGLTRKKKQWQCVCSCGSEVFVVGEKLRNGHTVSCGCHRKDRQKEANTHHGDHGSCEYVVWKGMRARCNNPKHVVWKHYGGRGIKVCSRWDDFSAFLQDMGRWATQSEQMTNTRKHKAMNLDAEQREMRARD